MPNPKGRTSCAGMGESNPSDVGHPNITGPREAELYADTQSRSLRYSTKVIYPPTSTYAPREMLHIATH